MKVVASFALLLIFVLSLNAASKTKAEIIATTGMPVIYEKRTLLTGLMSEAEYRKITVQLAKQSYFPSITRLPPNISANAKFGFNLNFGGLNRSWILDGDNSSGYVLYADLNGNGDLSDDTPLKFQNAGNKYSLSYQTNVKDGDDIYPFLIRLEISSETAPGQSSAKTSMAFYSNTARRGVIKIGGREINFELLGIGGFYNARNNTVLFDLNGDGRFDADTEKSVERYSAMEKYVNLGGTSYEYEVDRFGRSLTLKPLTDKLPDREALYPGNIAPDFSFTDTNGTRRRLSDYRGKLVLLDFWANWCPACHTEAPRLTEAYNRLRDKGFEIIGINNDADEASFKSFVAQYKTSWTQNRDDSIYEIKRLYRVTLFPTHYLIDKDGKIISTSGASKELINEIEKHLND